MSLLLSHNKVLKNTTTDDEVVVAAQKDHALFELLYTKYKDKIYKYFFYRVGKSEEMAEEMTQETFLKAFRSLDKFSPQQHSYLSYLLRIAHNLLVNYYRSSKLVLVENVNDLRTTKIDNIEAKIEAEKVWHEANEKLTISENKAMSLRYQNDLAVKDIAEMMHKTTNAVKLLLSHARKKLRTLEYFT